MIVISPNDLKIKVNSNTYVLKSFPFIGFSFTYLYYEPEVNVYRKVVLDFNNQYVYEDLTSNEILIIEQFISELSDSETLADFLSENEKRPEVARFNTDSTSSVTPKHAVDQNGFYVGQQVLPKDGLTEVPSFPPKDLYLEPFGIGYKWDSSINSWVVNGTYKERRKYQYLNQTTIGDQLDAIISAIDALSKGDPLPDNFRQLLEKIEAIKQSNPRT